MKRMSKYKNSKSGFTLIELIVVISIIAVLVLLGAPQFLGRTKDTIEKKHLASARILEDAAGRYYVDHQDWPRLTDKEDYFTSKQVIDYSDKIYDLTGKEIDLDPEGRYYDIDYEALSQYAKVPSDSDKDNYILRNPVGEIYYVADIDDKKKEKAIEEIKTRGKITGSSTYETEDVVFSGLNSRAFDGDTKSSYKGRGGTVTWTGDLTDREIEIKYRVYDGNSNHSVSIYFKDDNNVNIPSVGSNNTTAASTNSKSTQTVKLIVPEGATKIVINGYYTEVFDIQTVAKTPDRPIYGTISSTSTPSSITLKWSGVNRAIIHKDGKFLTQVKNNISYTHKPLYANSEHTYEIILIDENGNGQRYEYQTKTTQDVVAFRGLNASAFDGDVDTSYRSIGGGTVSWSGDLTDREIEIKYRVYDGNSNHSVSIYFKDDNNVNIPSVGSNDTTAASTNSKSTQTVKLVVPEGATKIVITGYYTEVFDIQTVAKTSDRPTNTTVSSSSTPSSITLKWSGANRAIIRRDGRYLAEVKNGTSYTDKPLYPNSEHTYEIILIDENGNGQRHEYQTKTTQGVVAFRGLNASAFDGDVGTSYQGDGTVTWTGDLAACEIEIRYKSTHWAYTSNIYFRNDDNINIAPVNSNNKTAASTKSTTMQTVKLIVPEEATKIVFVGSNTEVFDIVVIK